MGFFDKFKSTRDIAKEEIKGVKWVSLERLEQLDTLIEASKAVPVLIFKHSTTCGISKIALRSFEQEFDLDRNQVETYFLDLKQHRDISQAVAERFDVLHESPQILLIKNGTSVYDDSHGEISVTSIRERV